MPEKGSVGKKEIGYTRTERYESLENLQEAQSIPSINPINLNYFGSEQCEPGYTFGPYVRTNYTLHMVRSGRGVFMANGKTWQIHARQAFLIYPGETTTYRADTKDPWDYMWIGFHGFRCDEMVQRAGFSPSSPVLTCKNMDQISETMAELLRFGELNYVNELLRMSALYRLLALLTENSESSLSGMPGESDPEKLYVRKAVDLLINSREKTVRVADVASAIGISRSYLTGIFKREMKVSPQEFLMNFRMERAGDLLRSTASPVGVIAEELGYADSMAFSKAFRKHFQMSPTRFRELKPELVTLTVKGQFTGEHPL